jgi:alkaline phosphatase
MISLFIIVFSFSGQISPQMQPLTTEEPLSIILMIGDGMGAQHVELGRLVEFGVTGNLSMQEATLHLNITTHTSDNQTTDSAASATAMASGEKTENGMVSILPNGTSVNTILEIAQANGKATGLVATTLIQHATPAAFMTHVEDRNNYTEITRQIVEEAEVDVLLGGGRAYFSSAQIEAMESKGYSVVNNRPELLDVTSGRLLGLFHSYYLSYERVRDFSTTPSLSEMTSKALEILSEDLDGFFLMVEGSKIDYRAHSNDPVGVALETIAFDEAVSVALDYVQEHSNTVLIVTADHETGGLTIVSHSLSNDLPPLLQDDEDKRLLRIERAENVTVSWSTDGHTGTNVPLFAFGDVFNRFSNGDVIDNTDIFFEMLGYYSQDPTFRNSTIRFETSFDIATLLIGISIPLVAVLALALFIRRRRFQ